MLEHDKIQELMESTENYLIQLGDIQPDSRNLRKNIIAFLDREKTFKGYCEHHQDREEQGLLPELDKLTDNSWRTEIIGPFVNDWECCVKRNMSSINKIDIAGTLSGHNSDNRPAH